MELRPKRNTHSIHRNPSVDNKERNVANEKKGEQELLQSIWLQEKENDSPINAKNKPKVGVAVQNPHRGIGMAMGEGGCKKVQRDQSRHIGS